MYPTVEVRWFYQGEIPASIFDWFCQYGDPPAAQPPRLDYYFPQTNQGRLGIKLRQGCIELKALRHAYQVSSLHQQVHGVIEGWRKWSLPLAPDHVLITKTRGFTQSWIEVAKQRWLTAYTLRDGELSGPANTAGLSAGCHLELAQVEAKNTRWWSLGLEAFGEQNSNYQRLTDTAQGLFALYDPPVLEGEDSYSYPRWLEIIAA
jgi:hypothetical protein